MIFNFEEIPVQINGLTYLADGHVEYDWEAVFDEPWLESITVTYLCDIDGYRAEDLRSLAEDILVEEFYNEDNSLCKLVEAHWESMQ